MVVAALAAAVGAGAVVALNNGSTKPGRNVSALQNPAPSNGSAGSANATNIDVQSVASKVEPSIVDINSTLKYEDGSAAGTGIILSANGLVLTNNHVLEGSTHLTATSVTSGTPYQAKVIGVDPTDDIGVIQLEGASGLKKAQLGNSAKVGLGTSVVAIGNAGGTGGRPTVTSGTITALNRTITASDSGDSATAETLHEMLQTNAPIAPGDSGGALANAAGQVIGMNTAANSQNFGGNGTEMGFAIPISRAVSIAQQIVNGNANSKIMFGAPGFMGVGVDATSQANQCLSQSGISPSYTLPTMSGALVCNVFQDTPAAKAGISPGDVITGVNGQSVNTAGSLTTTMEKYGPGKTVSLTWLDPSKQSHTSSLTLIQGPIK